MKDSKLMRGDKVTFIEGTDKKSGVIMGEWHPRKGETFKDKNTDTTWYPEPLFIVSLDNGFYSEGKACYVKALLFHPSNLART